MDNTRYDFQHRQEIYLSSKISILEERLFLGPTQSPVQWIMVVLSKEVKLLGCKDNHVSPSSTEIKNGQH
jgi:hypothetical protein